MEGGYIALIVIVFVLIVSFSVTFRSSTGKPINWNSILFYILSGLILVVSGGTLWRSGQKIGAGLTMVLLLAVFVFFWLRWFNPRNGVSDVQTSGAGKCSDGQPPPQPPACEWPPIVNMCPDFMVAWQDTSKNIYCYDVNDVYGMKTYSGAGQKSGLTINGTSGQCAYLIQNSSKNTSAAQLSDDKKGLRWPFANDILGDISKIVSDSKGVMLRWEGVLEGNGDKNQNAERNMNRAYGLFVNTLSG